MNHDRSDSQTLSELRRGLLSSRSAKQQQTRSPPPKKRTPAQVAQARMAWKLRLQKDDRQLRGGEKVYEHAAYRSTSPRHSQSVNVNSKIYSPGSNYSQQPMRNSMSMLSPNSENTGKYRSGMSTRGSPTKSTSASNDSDPTPKVSAKTSKNAEAEFFNRRISQVNTLEPERAVTVSLALAESLSTARGAYQLVEADAVGETANNLYGKYETQRYDQPVTATNKSLPALSADDPVYNEIINMLHVAIPSKYARPDDAIIRAVAKKEGTLAFINHNVGKPTINCWVDSATLSNHNSVSQLNIRGGIFKKQRGRRSLLFSSEGLVPRKDWNGIVSLVLCKVVPGRQVYVESDEISPSRLTDTFYSDGIDFSVENERDMKLYDSHSVRTENGIRHLIMSPNQVLACWHVTFVPKVKVASPTTRSRNTDATGGNIRGTDKSVAHARVADWERRVNRLNMRSRSPESYNRGGNLKYLGRHHYEASKNAPEERKSATLAYHRLQVEVDLLKEGLEQNLHSLHDTVQAIHQNYFRAEEQITSNLQHALKGLLFTRSNRQYKLKAWRLQLKEYLRHINIVQRLHSTAARELDENQKKTFDAIFEDVAKNDFLPQIPRWREHVNPADEMADPIQVHISQRINDGPMVSEFYSPTKYNEHVGLEEVNVDAIDGNDGEVNLSLHYGDKISPPNTISKLPPSYALSHVLEMREKTEDPYKRESRIDALNARYQSRNAVKPRSKMIDGSSQENFSPIDRSRSNNKDYSYEDDLNSERTVSLSGSMLKRNHTSTDQGVRTKIQWKQRFFVLSGNKLKWKENQESDHVLGSVSLERYSVEVNKNRTTDFSLVSPKRTLVLRAFRDHGGPSSVNITRQQWIDCITANIHTARQVLRKKRGLLASFVDVEGLERLDYVLRENTYSIACASNESLKVKAEIDSLAQGLHFVFSAHGDIEYSKMVVQLAQSTKHPSLRHIFESQSDSISLAHRLLSMYIHHSTKDLVFKYLFPLVNIVQTSPQSYNLSAAAGNLSEEKIRNFQQLCSSFFRGIKLMCENSTAGLQYLMVSLSLRLKNVLGLNSRRSNAIVFGFILRNSIISALDNVEESFGKLSIGKISRTSVRVLKNVAEALKKLVNGLTFDSQSPGLNVPTLNTFLQNNFHLVEDFASVFQELYDKNATMYSSVTPSTLAEEVGTFTEKDTELLASGLHLVHLFAYKKGKQFWNNLLIDEELQRKMPQLQINSFVDIIFGVLGEPGNDGVRKNYGSTTAGNKRDTRTLN